MTPTVEQARESLARQFARVRGHQDAEAVIVTGSNKTAPAWSFYLAEADEAIQTIKAANLLAPAVGREGIARVIDPLAWEIFDQKEGERRGRFLGITTVSSLAKADAILALLSRTGEGKP